MKIHRGIFAYLTFLPSLVFAEAELPSYDDPLKDKYVSYVGDNKFSEFFNTGEMGKGYSVVCDMGNAIPIPDKKGWYSNQPIYNLKFELRAKLLLNQKSGLRPSGFVLLTKKGVVLDSFKPIGDMLDGKWDGDHFNSWASEGTDIEVFSERFGKSGYAHFDLLEGNGFYYKQRDNKEADFFLSNCTKRVNKNLPIYDWRYDFEENSEKSLATQEAKTTPESKTTDLKTDIHTGRKKFRR